MLGEKGRMLCELEGLSRNIQQVRFRSAHVGVPMNSEVARIRMEQLVVQEVARRWCWGC
jgi:hypothetical protein